jgi:hypothetical protein
MFRRSRGNVRCARFKINGASMGFVLAITESDLGWVWPIFYECNRPFNNTCPLTVVENRANLLRHYSGCLAWQTLAVRSASDRTARSVGAPYGGSL